MQILVKKSTPGLLMCCLRDPEYHFCTEMGDKMIKQFHWASTARESHKCEKYLSHFTFSASQPFSCFLEFRWLRLLLFTEFWQNCFLFMIHVMTQTWMMESRNTCTVSWVWRGPQLPLLVSIAALQGVFHCPRKKKEHSFFYWNHFYGCLGLLAKTQNWTPSRMQLVASSNPTLTAGCVCMLVAPSCCHSDLGRCSQTVVIIKAAANPRLKCLCPRA